MIGRVEFDAKITARRQRGVNADVQRADQVAIADHGRAGDAAAAGNGLCDVVGVADGFIRADVAAITLRPRDATLIDWRAAGVVAGIDRVTVNLQLARKGGAAVVAQRPQQRIGVADVAGSAETRSSCRCPGYCRWRSAG